MQGRRTHPSLRIILARVRAPECLGEALTVPPPSHQVSCRPAFHPAARRPPQKQRPSRSSGGVKRGCDGGLSRSSSRGIESGCGNGQQVLLTVTHDWGRAGEPR